MNLEFSNILLKHNKSVVNSRKECGTAIKFGNRNFQIPVVAANMKSIINKQICEDFHDMSCFYIYHRIDGIDDVYNFVEWSNRCLDFTSISVGVTNEWIELVHKLKESKFRIEYFTIDVALSYNDNIIPMVKKIKELYPNSFLIVGNGSTAEWVRWIGELELVDAIKVGIGVSKACRTRQFTGFGSTTVGSLVECVEENKKLNKPMKIISDGGLTVTNNEVWVGDIAKALILGADMVMSGAVYSRCSDSPAIKDGYFGNASYDGKKELKHIEGTNVTIKTSNLTIIETIRFIKESLQSSISYSGGKSLDEMKKLMYSNIQIVN